MGYVTRRAERTAVRGGGGFLALCFKIAAGVLVLFWPLAVDHHPGGGTSWVGYVIEGAWLALAAVVTLVVSGSRKKGTRHR